MSKIKDSIANCLHSSTSALSQKNTVSPEDFFVPKFSEGRTLLDLLISANCIVLLITLIPMNSWNSDIKRILLGNAFFINWVTIVFAYTADLIRPWLLNKSTIVAMVWCTVLFEGIIVLFTVLTHFVGHYVWQSPLSLDALTLLLTKHLALGFLFCWVVLYYLYVREQLLIRQRTELQARIQSLQSKIRPHFLFNSMNMLRSLISIDTQKAEKVVEDLSALFRASLNATGEVPMQDEITLCKRYLALERLRLGDRLVVEWVIPDEDALYDMNIPSLTLQPILENAIYHGVESRGVPSTIKILIESVGLEVRIVVTNPYELGKYVKKGNGIALANISERLQGYYGRSARCSVNQSNGVYTTYLSYVEQALDDKKY